MSSSPGCPQLHVDNDELVVAGFAQRCLAPTGTSIYSPWWTATAQSPTVAMAQPRMTSQCSERCSNLCNESRDPGITRIRLIL